MKTSLFAGIGLTAFWLAILMIFFSGSALASALAIYAVLATLVGLKRAYLIRPGEALSAVGALAYGAALNFGPAGGAIAGALSAVGYSYDTEGKVSGSKLFKMSASGATAGWSAGLAYTYSGDALAFFGVSGSTAEAMSIALPAVVCFVVLVIACLMINRRYINQDLSNRLRSCSSLSSEFAVGIALAAVAKIIYAVHVSDAFLLALPIIYMTRQSVEGLFLASRPSPPADLDRDKLAEVYLAAIRALIGAIDARDRFTRMHTNNIMKIALSIAKKLNLSQGEIEGLEMAAMFHDIGKLWVPEHILLKPGRLSPDQYSKIQHHPVLGQMILDKVNFPWPVGEIVRSHHERWDGTGYPDRLKGKQIPLGARILCLADVYDAMTSKRSYRASNSVEDTLKYVRSASGTHFDPAIVKVFEQVIADGDLPGVDRNMAADAIKDIVEGSMGQDREKATGNSVDDISRTSSEFVAMFEIAQTANTSLHLDKVLYLLAGKIKSMIPCAGCVILLKNSDLNILEAKMALGANSQYFEGAQASAGSGLTDLVAKNGEGMISGYDEHDLALPGHLEPWARLDEWIELQTSMIVPITFGDSLLGTINLYHTKPDAFSEEDLCLLTAVAPQVGKAIYNAILFKQTMESAQTDLVTGLHNARYLLAHLEQQLNRAKRLGKPLSVLYLDLDNFKAVNDTLGHQQGDVVLRDVASLFLEQVRGYDTVCRYAGDEFVIVLPDTEKAEALETARRVEAASDDLSPYGALDKQVRVGVSIGVSTFPGDGRDVRNLIKHADADMYANKKRRRENAAA